MQGMESYSKAATERAMKVQDVILRAVAKKITWWQAAEIIGISDRSMRRWRERYEEFGFRGLFSAVGQVLGQAGADGHHRTSVGAPVQCPLGAALPEKHRPLSFTFPGTIFEPSETP